MSDSTEEIKIACPHCGQHLAINPSMLEAELECPTCGKTFCIARPESLESPERESMPEMLPFPNEESVEPDDVSRPRSYSGGETFRKKVSAMPVMARAILSVVWKKALRPCAVFALAASWYLIRSAVRLVIRGARCLKLNLASVRPARWFAEHVFGLIDARWCKYEKGRLASSCGAETDASAVPELSAGRRVAYVVAGFFVICFAIDTACNLISSPFADKKPNESSMSSDSKPARAQTNTSVIRAEESTQKYKSRDSASAESLCREFVDGGNSYWCGGRRHQFWHASGTPFERIGATIVRWDNGGETPPCLCEVVFLEGGSARVTEDNTFFAREFRRNTPSEIADALEKAFNAINSDKAGLKSVSATVTENGHVLFSAEVEVSPGSVSDSIGKALFGMAKSRTLLRM